MPIPFRNEQQEAYVSRCIKYLHDNEGVSDPKIASGKCYGLWDYYKGKHTKFIAPDVRFSYETKAGHGLIASSGKKITLDTGKMCATAIFATESLDRGGDILHLKGINTAFHADNAVVLFNHGQEHPLPIGRTKDAAGIYTVQIGQEEATQTTYFSQQCPVALQIFQLIEEGVLGANSIGYRIVEAKRLPPLVPGLSKPGLELFQTDLLEISFVAVPMNPDCVLTAVSRGTVGTKAMCPAIKRELETTIKRMGLPSKTIVRGVDMTKLFQKPDMSVKTATEETVTEPTVPEATQRGTPHGAEVLHNVHAHHHALLNYLGEETKVMENKDLRKELMKLCSDTHEQMKAMEEYAKTEYPEHQLPAYAEKHEHLFEDDQDKADEVGAKAAQKSTKNVASTVSSSDGGTLVAAHKLDDPTSDGYDKLVKLHAYMKGLDLSELSDQERAEHEQHLSELEALLDIENDGQADCDDEEIEEAERELAALPPTERKMWERKLRQLVEDGAGYWENKHQDRLARL